VKSPLPDTIEHRRHFLRLATSSIGVVLTAPMLAALVSSCETDETQPSGPTNTHDVPLSKYPELEVVGGITADIIPGLNGDRAVFISRVSDTAFVVFSTVCTHQGCTVELPEAPGANCICGCHAAEYSSTDGKVILQPLSGSATDLPKFASSYNATSNVLTITG
jgi:Rieske Fe-S protein